MNFCGKCGLQTQPGSKFCARCGARIDDAYVLPPSPAPAQNQIPLHQQPPAHYIPPQTMPQMPQGMPPPPPVPQLPPKRLCTKCGVMLESDVLFCPGCGTKNYVYQKNKARQGELLMVLRGCHLIKLQILKTPGMLFIYDDRVFFQSDTPGGNIIIGFPDLTSAAPNGSSGLSMKLICANGKSYIFGLSDNDADFYFYIINLLTDYRF